MCPYFSEDAKRLWHKACNFHRGSDLNHVCSNPNACSNTIDKAFAAELSANGWD
jgi:hypothetical protein